MKCVILSISTHKAGLTQQREVVALTSNHAHPIYGDVASMHFFPSVVEQPHGRAADIEVCRGVGEGGTPSLCDTIVLLCHRAIAL
jgi:hypothetical protein